MIQTEGLGLPKAVTMIQTEGLGLPKAVTMIQTEWLGFTYSSINDSD